MPTIDPLVAVAGLVVGFIVGMTGMGGGALMTPILVIIFRVHPLAAIGSDLVASLFMKPVGGAVHWRRGNVEKPIAKWLLVGSIPTAFAGVFVVRLFGSGEQLQSRVQIALGAALLLASIGIVGKSYLDARRQRWLGSNAAPAAIKSRPAATVLVGAVVGLIVGMTSVGSGSLMIVLLMLLYPTLTSRRLVGTDLVQAIPLVGAAALGHVLVGDFRLNLTLSILLGSIPGVYLGSRLSAWAPDVAVRPVLVFVLLASALKLLNLNTVQLSAAIVGVAVILPPVWALIDTVRWKAGDWDSAGQSRGRWAWSLALGAILPGIGLIVSVAYFLKVRPRLARMATGAGAPADSGQTPDIGQVITERSSATPLFESAGQ